MKRIPYVTASVIALLLAGCNPGHDQTASPEKEAVPVVLRPLVRQQVSPPISTSGQFTSDDEAYLSFKTGGVIDRIHVSEGEAVRKGQLLASLQTGEIDALVQQAKAGEEKARRDYNRVKNLYADSVASREQMENAKTGLDVASRQLAIAEFNRRYSDIRALADGFVLKKLAAEGQIVGPGTPVLQTNGARRGIWLLTATLSDREWGRVSVNDPAAVTLDTHPHETLAAFVLRKSEGVDPRSGTFSVDLKITGPMPVRPASGMFGRARITPRQTTGGWMVPYGALIDADGESGYLFVTADGLKAQKVKVGLGDILRDSVLVISGLESAGSLIVSGGAYLSDKAPITVASEIKP
jgi:RND family efflux transporter MFP subunit